MTATTLFYYGARMSLVLLLISLCAIEFRWSAVPTPALLAIAIAGSACYVWHQRTLRARDLRYKRRPASLVKTNLLPMAVLVSASAMLVHLAGGI
jgi:hypothetical protein